MLIDSNLLKIIELLQATWVCSCPGSIGVHQDWCLGADLATQDQEHCVAGPNEGREEGTILHYYPILLCIIVKIIFDTMAVYNYNIHRNSGFNLHQWLYALMVQVVCDLSHLLGHVLPILANRISSFHGIWPLHGNTSYDCSKIWLGDGCFAD